jgi:hypothetical protein
MSPSKSLVEKQRDNGTVFNQRPDCEMQQHNPQQQWFAVVIALALLGLNAWYFCDLERQRRSREPFRIRIDEEDEGNATKISKVRRKKVALMLSFPNSVGNRSARYSTGMATCHMWTTQSRLFVQHHFH